MFERFSETARRCIFFARYEASQFGSPYIETEHLLLGVLREDSALAHRLLGSHAGVEAIRAQIDASTTNRQKISTSVDLPLSRAAQRALVSAFEEADSAMQKAVGTEHLMLGLLREENSLAAVLLRERGVTLERLRDDTRGSSWTPQEP